MGLLITTYAKLVNVWKTSGKAGDHWVNRVCRKIPVTIDNISIDNDIAISDHLKVYLHILIRVNN